LSLLRSEGALPPSREVLPVPLLRPLPDTTAGVRLLGKSVNYSVSAETECLNTRPVKDPLAFIYSLLDVLAYRLTFR
jgi:hypothetical protein